MLAINVARSHSFCIFSIMLFLTSCYADTRITEDYKLYDLGGSNQAIIGKRGMVSVSDVTSFKFEEGRILFEVGALNESPNPGGDCQYGYIDLEEESVFYAGSDGSLTASIKDDLRRGAQGVVSRSCLNR